MSRSLHDAIVVGAGIFGQTIAAELRRLGLQVLVLDGDLPRPGSRPSACLMKPSWFSSLGKASTDVSLETLDRLYGVRELRFSVGPAKLSGVKWVDPRLILDRAGVHAGTVTEIEPIEHGRCLVHWSAGERWELRAHTAEARLVVSATGAHQVPGAAMGCVLEARTGAASIWRGQQFAGDPFISPWAPYRQIVGFNLGPDVWVGDGTALKHWSEDAGRRSLDRCARAVGLPAELAEQVVGDRPYVDKKLLGGKPCYLEQRAPGLWIATGGAKNGTIAAGWAAATIGAAAQVL